MKHDYEIKKFQDIARGDLLCVSDKTPIIHYTGLTFAKLKHWANADMRSINFAIVLDNSFVVREENKAWHGLLTSVGFVYGFASWQTMVLSVQK